MALRIVVTGAAGFIGSHTVDQLLSAGHIVWGVDDFRTGRRDNLMEAFRNPSFTLREFDITDGNRFLQLLSTVHPDAVIHLAGLVSVSESIANPALNDLLNLQATRVVVEGARAHRVRRVVFASTAAVYGDPLGCPIAEDAQRKPLSPYGVAKLASENMVLELAQQDGLSACCLRYFNVYGPRQDPRSPYSGVISIFLDYQRRAMAPQVHGDGEQTRDFVSVHDVSRSNLIAATHPNLRGVTVNICTGQPTTINGLWRQISAMVPITLPPRYGPSRPGDIIHSFGRPDAADRELGFRTKIVLADGLSELARSC
jgi:UDP-glucose 4-epimerase